LFLMFSILVILIVSSAIDIYTLSLHDALPICVKIVKKVLGESGFDLEVSHDIDRLVIEKLFINIGINAITALLDRENACIYKDRSEEHTSELQSRFDLVCRLLLEKKNKRDRY